MHYSLLDKEWIPVLYRDGQLKRVGIRKVFEEAIRIRQIAASNPMDRVALLRFLLALLYWCKGNPPGGAYSGGSFPKEWFAKLDDRKDCFNLLGEGKRFYQCKSREDKSGKLSSNYLVHEVPTGTNLWHFRHSTDGTNGLCPACCAMGLLRLSVFATSGGRGKPPGINAKPPIYVLPLGPSLANTLLLTWREVSASNLGTPAWENPDLPLPEQGKVPLLTGLTWLPRRVWLDDPEEPVAGCISCGREEHLIRRCVFAGIGSTKTDSDDPCRDWTDPHIISDSRGIVKPPNALDAADVAAGQWAKVMPSILGVQRPNDRGTVWAVGFATVKNDKYIEAMEYEIPHHREPDTPTIQDSIKRRIEWHKEDKYLVSIVKKGASSGKHIEIRSMVDSIRPHVESRISARASTLIAGDDEAWEEAFREYGPMMAAIAKSLSPGYTIATVQRRRQIARAMSDM